MYGNWAAAAGSGPFSYQLQPVERCKGKRLRQHGSGATEPRHSGEYRYESANTPIW